MKPEAADCLTEARECLDGATQIAGCRCPQVAAREAYLATFHAAEAYIFEQTGRNRQNASRAAYDTQPPRAQRAARVTYLSSQHREIFG